MVYSAEEDRAYHQRKSSLAHKKHRLRKSQQEPDNRPPLSLASESTFYLEEEDRGVYDDFWHNMGYYLEHDVDFPPSSSTQRKRSNNRSPGWNGIFAFTFYWKEAHEQARKTIMQTLLKDYQCDIEPGEGSGPWTVTVKLTGKRVKRLTSLLNRCYARHQLVWKEG